MSLIGTVYNIRIHPKSLIVRKENLYDTPRSFPKPESIENLKKNIHRNIMSETSKVKCKRAIEYLLQTSINTHNYSLLNWKDVQFRMSFITLTLPARQVHSDNFIKRNCLNHFIVEAKRQWNVSNYVWRAEKQSNGNIHFHILTDKFIPHYELRACWNSILKNYGYIEQYRKNMKEFHNKGFKVRKDLLFNWPYSKQVKAYQLGVKTNWSQPNSTDIHSVRLVNNVGAYVTKYMTKENDKRKVKVTASAINYTKVHKSKKVNLSVNVLKFLREKAQVGRLWGCNHELSDIKGAGNIVDSRISDELNRIVIDRNIKVITNDYVKIFCIDLKTLIDKGCINLIELFSEYVCSKFILKNLDCDEETPLQYCEASGSDYSLNSFNASSLSASLGGKGSLALSCKQATVAVPPGPPRPLCQQGTLSLF